MPEDHPLIAAARAGDLPRVTELLAADPSAVNVRGWMGITPLIVATWYADSADIVRLLLDRGADPLAVRTNGDSALHWAASGPVATLLAEAAGPAGLSTRYVFATTPLHVAAENGNADVVRAFVAAGADLAAIDDNGDMPLDLVTDPAVAHVLVTAGAPLRTRQPSTPLHNAARLVSREPSWAPVIESMLAHGADPLLRDRFGAVPADLAGDHPVRARLVESPLGPAEAATSPHGRVALHPTRPEALTTMYSGTVLVRWRLDDGSPSPVEVIRSGGRRHVWGLGGGLAFSDHDVVWLRDWDDPRQVRRIPAELLPGHLHPNPVVSPDSRHLVLPATESVRLVDLSREAVVADVNGFGDWSVLPRFSPDGRTMVVGNSMQGTWWLTVLDVTDGTLAVRYTREDDLPTAHVQEVVTDLAFAQDGTMFATLVEPDRGGESLIVASRADSGATLWTHQAEASALCFHEDRLAVAGPSGVLWLDAATGAPVGENRTIGRVNALAARDILVAATAHGLHYVQPHANARP